MIDKIDQLDKQLFLLLNGIHSEFSDNFWATVTDTNFWVPLYALLLVVLIYLFKKDSPWAIVAIVLVIVSSDLFTSAFMKPFFARLRPCYDPVIGNLVHVVLGCGGKYGFASGHAANSFGLATIVWLLLRHRWPWIRIGFVWAAMVAYSRIAVGVHYPTDIITGAAVGIAFGRLWFSAMDNLYFRIRLKPYIRW